MKQPAKPITRQMKRKMMRDLNSPQKVSKMFERHDNEVKRNLDEFKKSKLRRRAIAFGIVLILGLAALFIFG